MYINSTIFNRFSGLLQDRPEMNENPSDVIRNSRVPIDAIIKIEELRVNPFARHLCSVFAQQNRNDPSATMMFEDFLDMMSVLSENAPAQVQLIRENTNSNQFILLRHIR